MPRIRQEIIKTPQDALRVMSHGLHQTVRSPSIFGYKPHKKQILFHASPAVGRIFLGGNRSGKTTGGVAEDVLWAMGKHPLRKTPPPPVRGRIVAVDIEDGIKKIIIPEVRRWLPPSMLINGSWEDSYENQSRTLTLSNQSFIEFMSYEQDVEKFAGTSRHFIHFDEEPPREIWQECLARLIDTGGHWWITATPLLGMTWMYDEVYVKAAYDPNFFSVEVDMDDNPYIGEAEKKIYLDTLSAEERKSRKAGTFVALGGKIYGNFDSKNIIDPFSPPIDWLDVECMDHGLNNPTAWLWFAVDREGNCLVYDEHYKADEVVGYHAKRVLEKRVDHARIPDYSVGDPSITTRNPITGTTIQLEYYDCGVSIIPGNNDVKAGINRVKQAFGQNLIVDTDGVTVLQEKILPRLYIARNCVNLIYELRRYRWASWATKKMSADRNRKDEPHKKDDHACDALRYGVASRPEYDTGQFVPDYIFDADRARNQGIQFSSAVSEKRTDPGVHEINKEDESKYVDSVLGGEW